MTILLDYEKQELYKLFESFDLPKFRVDQILNAMYNGKDFGDNINLPKELLEKLSSLDYVLQPIKIRKAISSGGKDKFWSRFFLSVCRKRGKCLFPRCQTRLRKKYRGYRRKRCNVRTVRLF